MNGYSITQTLGGLDNQTKKEQPIKQRLLWKDLTALVREYEI